MIRQTLIRELVDKKNLQVLIDRSSEIFRPQIWKNHFDWKFTNELNWSSYMGATRNAAAASVTTFDASAPLRTRKTIKKASGEIPTLQEMFKMDKKDLRFYLEQMKRADADQKMLLDLVFDDIKEAAEAPGRRLDMFVLEALSTGQITINTTNNPDGMVLKNAIDIGIPAANKKGTVGDPWSNSATATPITDIETVVKTARDKGVIITKMYMRTEAFNNLKKATETKELMASWVTGNKNSSVLVTLKSLNEFLSESNLPTIELKDQSIAIEKNGDQNLINPWNQYNVAFVASPKLGKMLHSFTVEQLAPQEGVTYATYDKVLIKRWGQINPLEEYTACEIPAFPAFDNVGSIFLLNTNNKGSFE